MLRTAESSGEDGVDETKEQPVEGRKASATKPDPA
jgi:hypothetical protein